LREGTGYPASFSSVAAFKLFGIGLILL